MGYLQFKLMDNCISQKEYIYMVVDVFQKKDVDIISNP